jgi:hypothetical protein
MSTNTLNNTFQYLIQYVYNLLLRLRHLTNNTNQHCASKTDFYNILFYRTVLCNQYIRRLGPDPGQELEVSQRHGVRALPVHCIPRRPPESENSVLNNLKHSRNAFSASCATECELSPGFQSRRTLSDATGSAERT